MREIGAFEAKTHFSELLVAVEAGESITVTRRGKPVAVLSPVREADASKLVDEILEARKKNSLGGMTWRELRDYGRR